MTKDRFQQRCPQTRPVFLYGHTHRIELLALLVEFGVVLVGALNHRLEDWHLDDTIFYSLFVIGMRQV